MGHFMHSFGNLKNPVDTVIEAYCRHCAIRMNCVDLARAVGFLANGGVSPVNGEQVLDASSAKRLSRVCGSAGGVIGRLLMPLVTSV